VLDGTRALYVHRLHAHRAGQHQADGERRVGAALPLHCSALGKALMAALAPKARRALLTELTLDAHGPNSIAGKRRLGAELDAVGESGLSLSDEELAAGVRSVAVAVPARSPEEPLVAVDVTAPARACSFEQLAEDIAQLVREAADRIAQERPALAQRRARRPRQR
jgi:DNA-binding IclR family transcriptional regulator